MRESKAGRRTTVHMHTIISRAGGKFKNGTINGLSRGRLKVCWGSECTQYSSSHSVGTSISILEDESAQASVKREIIRTPHRKWHTLDPVPSQGCYRYLKDI